METQNQVLEYKCPCCDAKLVFGSDSQKMTCEYCENEFDLETVRIFQENTAKGEETAFHEDAQEKGQWSEAEESALRAFVCPSCGGEILTEQTTAATFCPYCENPAIIPTRISGILRPDALIPFKKTKEDAKAAFLELCKGKPLLPRMFTQEQRLEKITGMYVPFWLYDCSGDLDISYKATRSHHWSDSKYHYTKTEHFLLERGGRADFARIPMDGSKKMDDVFMESIEPYDYSQLVDFDSAYLSGYLADKYDVPWEDGKERIRQRVDSSLGELARGSCYGYSSVLPASRKLDITHKASYVLLPVWMLNTQYNGKTYTFAMNGQTGKMTGAFPICTKRAFGWFSIVAAAAAAVSGLVQFLLML